MLPTKKLPNRSASTSETAAQGSQVAQFAGQPIEITLTGIGLANRGAKFLPAAAGSKVAQFRGLAAVLATLPRAILRTIAENLLTIFFFYLIIKTSPHS